MPYRQSISSLFTCALFVSLFVSGCATTSRSIYFSKSELELIPVSSLRRMVSTPAADEVVIVGLDGRDGYFEVKEFKGKDSAIVSGLEGKAAEVRFSDITALLIHKKPEAQKQMNPPKEASTSSSASATAEALIYAPLVPLVTVSPLFGAMGLNASDNSADNAKARLIYHGMSRQDLLSSIGTPKEKYACILKLPAKGVAQEVWVYEDRKVLRGGRALFIDRDTGAVSHNSFHTSFFKGSGSFDCSILEP